MSTGNEVISCNQEGSYEMISTYIYTLVESMLKLVYYKSSIDMYGIKLLYIMGSIYMNWMLLFFVELWVLVLNIVWFCIECGIILLQFNVWNV